MTVPECKLTSKQKPAGEGEQYWFSYPLSRPMILKSGIVLIKDLGYKLKKITQANFTKVAFFRRFLDYLKEFKEKLENQNSGRKEPWEQQQKE